MGGPDPILPVARAARGAHAVHVANGAELVVARDPFHACAEQLRALRTQLVIRWDKAGVRPRRLAVVSAGTGEGRSYLAANLAVAFAQLGERTLLVDADLRAPRQDRIFGVGDAAGLAALLAGRAGREALVPLPEHGALALLPAGAPPHNPQELLSRPALGALLEDLRTDFDVVVLDTPPARPYADAQSVAFRAGHALVIARQHRTSLADAGAVVRQLGDAGACVVGAVCNAF
ncbi:MAG TPA: polysaccharide biosynthesis tyrosine autokinase [Burkholderiales bacterium]|nr:polysaccharide biosynthesis tyrosine autokinase [Burkholderiales bacterium]